MSKCLYGMVLVSIQEHNSSATVCHVNHHGLILFGILEGAPLFLCDIISLWLGFLDTGSNSSPDVLESLCNSYSDFRRDLGEYHMAEMLTIRESDGLKVHHKKERMFTIRKRAMG